MTGASRVTAKHLVMTAVVSLSVGVEFIPLVVESLGGWSEEAVHNICRIGRLLGQRTGAPPAESTRHLFQRLAISLWRSNASMWAQRLPTHPAWVGGAI